MTIQFVAIFHRIVDCSCVMVFTKECDASEWCVYPVFHSLICRGTVRSYHISQLLYANLVLLSSI